MPRQIRIGENFDGLTLGSPGLEARQSYIRNCSLVGATVLGDWRGSDILGCDLTNANLTGAQTYACYWRGNTMLGATFPADIGWLHHEPVAEIIRAAAASLPPGTVKTKIQAVGTFVLSDYKTASWDSSKAVWWDTLTAAQKLTAVSRFRALFAPYPQLAARFEELIRAIQGGGTLWAGSAATSGTLTWPDGASVTVDALALPPLPELSRYGLARWMEAQADLQAPGPHYCFVAGVVPIHLWALPDPDTWWQQPRAGY